MSWSARQRKLNRSISSILLLCMQLTGKTSIVKDTALAKLAMVDPIFIALPVSILVTIIIAQLTKIDIK